MATPPLRLLAAALAFLLIATAPAATFPLPIPQRPTTFPLSRPSIAGEVVAWGLNDFAQCSVPPGLTNIVAVAAANRHSVALRSDGTVVAWGNNEWGQTNVPPELNDVVAISAGWIHNLALKSDGRVVAWGWGGEGRTTVPPSLSDAVAVSAGGAHSLALRMNGSIIGWGANFNGQATPPKVSTANGERLPPTNAVAISAGNAESFALLADNRTIYWGPFGFDINGPMVLDEAIVEAAAIATRPKVRDLRQSRRLEIA